MDSHEIFVLESIHLDNLIIVSEAEGYEGNKIADKKLLIRKVFLPAECTYLMSRTI